MEKMKNYIMKILYIYLLISLFIFAVFYVRYCHFAVSPVNYSDFVSLNLGCTYLLRRLSFIILFTVLL